MASPTRYFVAEPSVNLNAQAPSSTTSLTIAYRTYGSPSSPAILLPTCFGGLLDEELSFLYLPDPSDKDAAPPILANSFVIEVGMLCGSESSSPSNAHPSIRGRNFPKVTINDGVQLQHALCRALGVSKLHAAIGFSMGGLQVYQLAVRFPDFVERIIVLAGSARASWHNISFLEGPRAALVNSVDFHDGDYTSPATRGTRAFGRVYSTWALSSAWYRERCWEKKGFKSMWEYVAVEWEEELGKWDAHDLLGMLQMWQRADISAFGPVEGDFEKALDSIRAKVLLMPSRSDLYFPPEDSEYELKHLRHGQLKVIESIYGHTAGGGGGTQEDAEFIKACIKEFLA
jgi:homoserine acetyltransferase